MYKTRATQLSFVEEILYKQLPEDKLSQINNMIDWQPFEKILAKLHPSKEGRPAYNPLQMFKILIIQQMYKHSDPDMEQMLYSNNFYRRFVGLTGIERVPDHSTICRFRKSLEGMGIMQELFEDHIAVDVENEFVVAGECTPANAHDSQILHIILLS